MATKKTTDAQKLRQAIAKAGKESGRRFQNQKEREAKEKYKAAKGYKIAAGWQKSTERKKFLHAQAQNKYRNAQRIEKYVQKLGPEALKAVGSQPITVISENMAGYWQVRELLRTINSISGNKIIIMEDIRGGETAQITDKKSEIGQRGAEGLTEVQASYARRNLRDAEAKIKNTPKGTKKNYMAPRAEVYMIGKTKFFRVKFDTTQ